MKNRQTMTTVALAAACAFVLGLIIAGSLAPRAARSSPERDVIFPDPGDVGAPQRAPRAGWVDFAEIIESANPAVVNVTVVGTESSDVAASHEGDPFSPFGDRPSEEDSRLPIPHRGAGSGFFIDKSGYLLTNHHVIDTAERVDVTLMNRTKLRARVVGSDAVTDLALLKVDQPGNYPAIALGDSDRLRVGEWVCAIGNPLRMYDHTVTVGVVSYKGRVLWNPSFDNYIQTDAAINFGNSGGPLLNARGEVVGIATAVSQQGQGIGFAIPINTAKEVLQQLREEGRVTRGYLGVFLDDVDAAYAQELGLGEPRGAVVTRVSPDSAAERAGLKRYDVILGIEGQSIENSAGLVKIISALKPGDSVRVEVYRDGGQVELVADLDERHVETASIEPEPSSEQGADGIQKLGLSLEVPEPAGLRRYGLPGGAKGLLVKRVDPLSSAAREGIQSGDLLTEINRRPVADMEEYRRIVEKARPGDLLLMYIVRSADFSFVAKVIVER